MDAVMDPVTTPCGHLFCGPCLYVWLDQSTSEVLVLLQDGAPRRELERNSSCRTCPICRYPCSVRSVLPKHECPDEPVRISRLADFCLYSDDLDDYLTERLQYGL
jgi:Zinc finger, C3HC4 type (RING finger)